MGKLSPRYRNAERIGAHIRAHRRARKWSATVLGQRAGFSQQLISQVERGAINTPIETLMRIADVLGVSLDEILRGDSPRDAVGTDVLVRTSEVVVSVTAECRQNSVRLLRALAEDVEHSLPRTSGASSVTVSVPHLFSRAVWLCP